MINNYFPSYKGEHYRELSNTEYVTERQSFVLEYSSTKNINEMYPPSTGRGKVNITHILVSPNMLKEMFMVCPTERQSLSLEYSSNNKNNDVYPLAPSPRNSTTSLSSPKKLMPSLMSSASRQLRLGSSLPSKSDNINRLLEFSAPRPRSNFFLMEGWCTPSKN